MSHLGTGSVGAGSHQAKSDRRAAVGAFCPNRFFVEDFVLIFLEPHELKTLRAASHLRSHGLPLTLRFTRTTSEGLI